MFLAEEGKDFSLLIKLALTEYWEQNTLQNILTSFQMGFPFICANPHTEKFCSKLTYVPRERDLHICAREALVPFSGLGPNNAFPRTAAPGWFAKPRG